MNTKSGLEQKVASQFYKSETTYSTVVHRDSETDELSHNQIFVLSTAAKRVKVWVKVFKMKFFHTLVGFSLFLDYAIHAMHLPVYGGQGSHIMPSMNEVPVIQYAPHMNDWAPQYARRLNQRYHYQQLAPAPYQMRREYEDNVPPPVESSAWLDPETCEECCEPRCSAFAGCAFISAAFYGVGRLIQKCLKGQSYT